nr:UDP-N-acetylmuramoyl-L-alanyl-D-glutamate--2,6-diaminopimelate ligase MurE homolog, chloroplastic [Tanacetum cinerariifolium]
MTHRNALLSLSLPSRALPHSRHRRVSVHDLSRRVGGGYVAAHRPDFWRAITGLVDYAHTPDALENVLQTLQQTRRPEQRIITVVGCGGNRDAAKRPIMARLAAQLSDQVILTADNPRDEDPQVIIDQMQAGLTPPADAHVRQLP